MATPIYKTLGDAGHMQQGALGWEWDNLLGNVINSINVTGNGFSANSSPVQTVQTLIWTTGC